MAHNTGGSSGLEEVESTWAVIGGNEEERADARKGMCSGPSALGRSMVSVFSEKEERVSLDEKGFEESRGSVKQLLLIAPLYLCLYHFP